MSMKHEEVRNDPMREHFHMSEVLFFIPFSCVYSPFEIIIGYPRYHNPESSHFALDDIPMIVLVPHLKFLIQILRHGH
jgi:hypothetical protein